MPSSLIFTIFISFWCLHQVLSVSQTFTYKGYSETFTVPAGVSALEVEVVGGTGGQYAAGTLVTVTNMPVLPGQILNINVGGNGGSNGVGGYNGGGTGSGTGYGGGGASDIRNATHRLVIAAGGGGQGYVDSVIYGGGYGGCVTGVQGYPTSTVAPNGGFGGSQTTGGSGGKYSVSYASGSAGVSFDGGDGAYGTNGGGGGGGYFGGGGGANSGGGGGSSYSEFSDYTCTYSYYLTQPYVTITYATVFSFTFNEPGQAETLEIPSDVSEVIIQAAGAQGGNFSSGFGSGGLGGYISGNFSVGPYSTLTIMVGGTNGYNGGNRIGSSTNCGNDAADIYGGGATTVTTTPFMSTSATTLIIVGGGGSAGYDSNCSTLCAINGGCGGGDFAGQGAADPNIPGSYGGLYGTQLTGGGGGYSNSNFNTGLPGSLGMGGAGAPNTCGGGGGGGYYGGGGGSFTGGGGGSTFFFSSAGNKVSKNICGNNTGDGFVIVKYTSAVGPVTNDDDGNNNNKSKTLGAGEIVTIVIGILFGTGVCFSFIQYKINQKHRPTAPNTTATTDTARFLVIRL